MTKHWRLAVIVVLTGVVVLGVVLTGSMLLQRGMGPAWVVNINLQRVQLVAGTARAAHCPRPGRVSGPCKFGDPLPEKTLVVWLVQRWDDHGRQHTSGRRVLTYKP